MLGDLWLGPWYLLRGFELIRTPGLRRFVVAPILVNVLVLGGLLWWLGTRLNAWLTYWLAGLPGWLHWLESLLWWLGFALGALLFCYLFTLVANIIAGPFNGVLSARVEQLLTGKRPESGLSMAREALDAVTGEVRLWAYYAGRALLLLLLTLVLWALPVVNALVPAMWFVFGAFMLAFEYLDNPMGNRGMHFADKLAYLHRRRWLTLSFGGATTLFTLIPLANLVVMPAAVAGATALWVDHLSPAAVPARNAPNNARST